MKIFKSEAKRKVFMLNVLKKLERIALKLRMFNLYKKLDKKWYEIKNELMGPHRGMYKWNER